MDDLKLHAEEGCMTERSHIIPESESESEWREVKFFPAQFVRIHNRSTKKVNARTPEKWARHEKEQEQEQLAEKIAAKQPRVTYGVMWINPGE